MTAEAETGGVFTRDKDEAETGGIFTRDKER